MEDNDVDIGELLKAINIEVTDYCWYSKVFNCLFAFNACYVVNARIDLFLE